MKKTPLKFKIYPHVTQFQGSKTHIFAKKSLFPLFFWDTLYSVYIYKEVGRMYMGPEEENVAEYCKPGNLSVLSALNTALAVGEIRGKNR